MDSWFVQHPEITRYILEHEAKRHQTEQEEAEPTLMLPEWAQAEPEELTEMYLCRWCHSWHPTQVKEYYCPLDPNRVK